MAKLNQLSRNTSFGDYVTIAEIFNQRHKAKDQATVSTSYVGKVIRKERPATPGTIAEEVSEIAQIYFQSKQQMKRELIAA